VLKRIYARFARASIDSQRIVKGMLAVAGFLLVAKAIAAAKEVVLAHSYGTSAVLDGHLFAFNLASWPVSVLAAALWFGLTPAWVKLSTQDELTKKKAAADLLGLVLVLAIAASLLVAGVLYWLLQSNISGLGAVAQAAALDSMWAVLVFLLVGCLAALYATWLMSAQRHGNTLLEAAPAAAIALTVLVFFGLGHRELGVSPLNIGLATGAVLQLVLLAWLFKEDGPKTISWPRRGSMAWTMLHGMGLALLAQVVMSSTVLVDTLALARMGEGALAAYTYAQRLMALAIGLTAMVIGRAVLPVFSAQTDKQVSLNLAKVWGWRMFGLGCLGAVLIALAAKPAVVVLFQHGAFTEEDSAQVAWVLMLLGLQLPFYMASTVWFSWLISLKHFVVFLALAVFGLIAKILFLWFLFLDNVDIVALSTVVSCMVHWIVILSFSYKLVGRQNKKKGKRYE